MSRKVHNYEKIKKQYFNIYNTMCMCPQRERIHASSFFGIESQRQSKDAWSISFDRSILSVFGIILPSLFLILRPNSSQACSIGDKSGDLNGQGSVVFLAFVKLKLASLSQSSVGWHCHLEILSWLTVGMMTDVMIPW